MATPKKLSEAEFAAEQEAIAEETRKLNITTPLDEQVGAQDDDEEPAPEPEGRIADPETPEDAANRGNKSTKRQTKAKEAPESREFSVAHSVGPIAKLLIADHYPALSRQDIRYVFTTKASEVDGEVVVCKSSKLSGLAAWLAGGSEDGEASPMFVVVISESHWSNMPARGKEAFLDQALAYFAVSNTGALRISRPDIVVHSAVLARYGLFSAKLKAQKKLLEKAILQPSLAIEEGGA